MNSANAVLITLACAFIIICVTMVFMHPDHQYGDPENVVTLLTPATPTYLKVFNEAIRRFEAKFADRGWRVKYISVPYSHYYRKVEFMEVMNDQADVIYMDQRWFPGYMDKGMIEDLNPWIDGDPEFKREEYFDMALKNVAFEGQQAGLPFLFSPVMLFYNKNAFVASGVEFPKPGWTYTEFLDTAQKLSRDENGDGRTDFFGVVNVAYSWEDWVWRAGGDQFTEDLSRCTLDTPESIEGLQYIQDLIHKYKVAPSPANTKALADDERFRIGQAGMVFGTRFSREKFLNLKEFEWDVAPIPSNPKTGLSTTTIYVDSISLAKHGKNKKLGWELMKFLVCEEMARAYLKIGTGFPGLKHVASEGLDPNIPGDKYFLDVPDDTRYPFRPYRAKKEVKSSLERPGGRLDAIWMGREKADVIAREVTNRINEGIERELAREARLYGPADEVTAEATK